MKRDLSGFAPTVLRAILGFGFLYHGLPKLGDGHAGFIVMLSTLGIPAPEIMAWVVGIVEVVGGLALWAGVATTAVAAVLGFELLVALIKVHVGQGFNFVNIVDPAGPQFGMPGYEPVLLYMAGLVSLVLTGPGKLTVSEVVKNRQAVARPAPQAAMR